MECDKIRCLIIDDEPLAIKVIRTYLTRLDSFEVAGECRNALKAIEFLLKDKIDLMFLDINMPEISGLDFLTSLPNPPFVIITTAFCEYAIEGYDLDVVDFLIKPISFERFLKAINKYSIRAHSSNTKKSTESQEKKYIHIHDGKDIFKLQYEDIIYFEGYGEYVKVITTNKTYLVRDSMSAFENRFSPNNFIRIHKSYIINIQKVTRFNTIHVLVNNIELPVGRIYREKAMNILKEGNKS
ncbi:MAG TPA: LytTR family DNA-binding domain-containing protein [Bacteroidales bacterium]|jgi:DNA-binding LytR/AlgR family response regulator|nr:LytTR family DNA-binding domain-containing protein [Bacteroidales bacterium]